MVAVMIGVDPHKASHTAVATNPAEEALGQLRVRASTAQADQLLAWAQAWPERPGCLSCVPNGMIWPWVGVGTVGAC